MQTWLDLWLSKCFLSCMQWQITMCSTEGDPGWHKPMIALVVIVSVILTVFVFWGMLMWCVA